MRGSPLFNPCCLHINCTCYFFETPLPWNQPLCRPWSSYSVSFSDHLFYGHLHVGNSRGECENKNNTKYLYIILYFIKCFAQITTFTNIYQTVITDTIWMHIYWSLFIFFFQNFSSNKKWLLFMSSLFIFPATWRYLLILINIMRFEKDFSLTWGHMDNFVNSKDEAKLFICIVSVCRHSVPLKIWLFKASFIIKHLCYQGLELPSFPHLLYQ